jgi:hypothetical protein
MSDDRADVRDAPGDRDYREDAAAGGWALATWIGLLAGVAAAFVLLLIDDRPWLGVSAGDRWWMSLAGGLMVTFVVGVSRFGTARRQRCAYSASLFVGLATVVFVLGSL